LTVLFFNEVLFRFAIAECCDTINIRRLDKGVVLCLSKKAEELTDVEVKQIVGDEYDKLTGRVKELIRVPSSLYVWLKLDSKRRSNQITSSQEIACLQRYYIILPTIP